MFLKKSINTPAIHVIYHFTNLLRKLKLLKYLKVDNALIQAALSCQPRRVILAKCMFEGLLLTKNAKNESNHSCQNVVTLFLLSLAGSVLSKFLTIRE